MCRMVVFSGSCTRCGESQTWDHLTQHLSCLEAKNNCAFGECDNGVYQEKHDFDQECERCEEEDEGIGDVDNEADDIIEVASEKRPVRRDEDEREAKRQRT